MKRVTHPDLHPRRIVIEAAYTEPTKKVPFTHEELLKALYFIFDLLTRPNIPFFLLEETAEAAKNHIVLSGDHITVGVRYLDFQPRTLSILEAFYLAEKVTKEEILYNYAGIPIMVKVIHSDDPMYRSTDTILYEHEYFQIPNPFDQYQLQRGASL